MKKAIGYISLIVPILGLAMFFVCFERGLLNVEIRRLIWFCSVCIGLSGTLYYACDFKSSLGILQFIGSLYFAYLLLVYAMAYIFGINLDYKWIYISTGGMLACIILGISFKQNYP